MVMNDTLNINEIPSSLIQNDKSEIKSKLWLQAILDNSSLNIMAFESIRDENGNIEDFEFLFINKKAEESLSRVNLTGKRFKKEFPGIYSGLFDLYTEVTETGKPLDKEIYYNYDGYELWASINATKLEDGCLVMYSDISDRKKAEQREKEFHEEIGSSNTTIRRMLDGSIAAICLFDTLRDEKGRIIDFIFRGVNKASEVLNKKGENDLIGKGLIESFPEVNEVFFKEYVKVVETGIPLRTDLEGYDHWYRSVGVKLGDGLVVSTEDITDRKKVEYEIKKTKELLNLIFESLPMHLSFNKAFRDSEGRVSDFIMEASNASNLKINGLSKDELGKSIQIILPEIKNHPFYQTLVEVAEKGFAQQEESSYYIDNKLTWLLTYYIPITDGVLVAGLDITDRKKAEDDLRESQHFIQQIADTTPDMLLVFDVTKKKVIYVNKEIYTTLGYTPESIYQMENKVFEQLLHPDDYQKLIIHYSSLLYIKHGEVREIEMRIIDSNNNWHWYSIRETLFKAADNGKAQQILAVCQNITSQKQAEAAFIEERTRNLELKRINEVMDTFVFAAAHDLKAPVSNLKLLTNVIENTSETAIRNQLQGKYLPIIETLEKTITGLVRVLEIENDSSTGVKNLFFKDIFHSVLNELSENVNAQNVKIHADFIYCQSITYIESYMLSIFRNTLSNALKYKSDNRELIVNINTQYSGKYVLFTIRDNGIGIDLEIFGKDLFKPFKRFSTQSEGTGIGLHLIKSMVSKNGGKIEVESELGAGTTFKIFMAEYK